MVELRDAVTRMCGYWGGRHQLDTEWETNINLSRVASLLDLDAGLRRDEEPNQKHFQLTDFISQSTIHLHFEGRGLVAAHPQKSGTCQT